MLGEVKILLSRKLMNETSQFYVGYYNSTQTNKTLCTVKPRIVPVFE